MEVYHEPWKEIGIPFTCVVRNAYWPDLAAFIHFLGHILQTFAINSTANQIRT